MRRVPYSYGFKIDGRERELSTFQPSPSPYLSQQNTAPLMPPVGYIAPRMTPSSRRMPSPNSTTIWTPFPLGNHQLLRVKKMHWHRCMTIADKDKVQTKYTSESMQHSDGPVYI